MYLGRGAALASGRSDAKVIEMATSGRAGQCVLSAHEGLATGPLLAGRQDARKDTVKLFDREVLTDVTICTSPERGVHPLFVIADAGEHDDGEALAHFADKRDQGNTIDFGHVEVHDGHVAAVVFEPGCGFETFGEEFAGVAFLLEVSDEELGNGGIILY